MKRTFQKWLLFFVAIAFIVTFIVFFFVMSWSATNTAKQTIASTLSSTETLVETNYSNLTATIDDSKNYGIDTARVVKAVVERDGTASYVMNKDDAIDFNVLYFEVFDDVDTIGYDDEGKVNYDSSMFVRQFVSDETRTKTEKEIAFNNYFVSGVKPCMEYLYGVSIETTSDCINFIDECVNPYSLETDSGGYIISSTICGYFGYDMCCRNIDPTDVNYNSQSVDFMKMIYAKKDTTGTYAQDLEPDSSGNYWQYAGITSSDAHVGIYQTGTLPYNLLETLERLNFKNIISPISCGSNGIIVFAQLEDYVDGVAIYKRHIISGITNDSTTESEYVGEPVFKYGIPETYLNGSTYYDNFTHFGCFGSDSYVNFVRGPNPLTSDPSDDYVVIGVMSYSAVYGSTMYALIVLIIGELIVFLVIFILVSKLIKIVVINGIHKVNGSLQKITSGDLKEKVNVTSNPEFVQLSSGINSMVEALRYSIEQEKTRMARDLALAKSIQESSLPRLFPPYPERDEFSIYATMLTAKEVGGDFYDFFFIDGERLAFIIADVSGKGVPAALFMMTAKTLIKNLAETRKYSPEEIITKANAELCANNEAEMFVTAFFFIVNVSTGEATFVNAGHNAPLIKKNGKFEYLTSKHGFVLGGVPTFKYKQETMQLEKDDVIYLYTDGVTEAVDKNDAFYGDDRLIDLLNEKCLDMNPTAIIETVSNDVKAFTIEAEQSDDITQLCFKYLKGNDKNGN